MSARPPVTIVVLAWNRWPLTAACLASLQATALEGASILVVDNGSTDETPERLADWPGIEVLTLPENRGFVRGNNAGIAASDPASDVLLLNNDVVVEQKDWLRRLREAAHAAPDVGVVGARLALPDGRLLHAGTYVLPDTLWGQQIGATEVDVGQYTRRRDVEGIVFACAYLKREVLEAIGGLSEDYVSYFEDTDYCLRAAEAGFRTVLAGDVTLVHDEHGSTKGDSQEHMRLFQASREVFSRQWKERLEARYQRSVHWQSILNLSTGYAMSSRGFLTALDRMGVRASYEYVYGRGTPFPVDEPSSSGDYRLDVIAGRDPGKRPAVSVVYGQGDVFSRNRGRYRIGYTMLEVDGFPADWVRQANRLDEVWVPTELNRQAFLACGLERPVYKIPLGVDVDYFHPGIVGHPSPSGEFVFLSSFEWGERKEPWLLLQTFNDVFTAREPVRLVCKVINRDPSVRLKDEIARLGLRESGGKISWLFNYDFPHYQLGSLYRSADCFVSVSRGEGWNMPLMEAMACGLPAIATDWSGHPEFLHDGIGYPLAVERLVPAVAKCPYYEGFRWASPSEEHLRHLLRHVYENREEAMAKGRAAAGEMAERWTWEKAAGKIVERLVEVGGR